MARDPSFPPLDDGALFPAMVLRDLQDAPLRIPDPDDPRPVLLTIYRGRWCGVCRGHLAELQSIAGELMEGGARVIAASTETQAEARVTAAELGLTFPVAWGLVASGFAALTGAFYHAGEGYLHATAFALRGDGRVVAAVYGTGPRGRFTAADWRVNLKKALAPS